MDDETLLLLAAKAAGIDAWWSDHDGFNCMLLRSDGNRQWNPLKNDGDALRLAVTCGLVVDTSRPSAGEPFKLHHCGKDGFTDRNAATRRAITRAAAAIGATAQGGGSGK